MSGSVRGRLPEAAGSRGATGDDEAALVAHAQQDRRAFAPLYARYLDPIYRYCALRLGDREAAEDATSLVFVKALAALPSCDAAAFRGWLFAIAHNVVADQLRAQRPDQSLDEVGPLVAGEPTPEEVALAAEAAGSLRARLDRLPADQRRVVEWRLAGLTGAEIAEAMGRSLGAVKMLQSRALDRLEQQLRTEHDSAEGA